MSVVDHAPLAESTSVPLSRQMREGSQAEHTAAEGSSFMEELLAGRLSAQGYTDYLLRLRRVYEALESTGRALATDPIVSAVHDPALERLAAIDADLVHWSGGTIEPATARVDSPAAEAYRARVLESATDTPLFVAHHYTRYLGDLSGGQAIGRILDREFDLGGAGGIAFYDFPAIPKPKPYKDGYRARLDALVLDAGQQSDVVDEVRVAFRLNQSLFAELGTHLEAYRR